MRLAVEGETIQIYGDGSQLRDLCFVDDAVDAFLRVGASHEADGQVYNLGGSRPISLLEIAETMVRITGRGRVELVPWPEERKRIDIGDVYSSYERIEAALGWSPQTSPEDGLQQTIDYNVTNLQHYI